MNKEIRITKNEAVTQQDHVYLHLKNHKSITSKIAWDRFGCTRLSVVIERMRKRGYSIETKMIETQNRYGTKTSYAKYIYNAPK